MCVCVCVFPHLCEDEGLRVAAVQAEDEADGLEQFLDAGAELFLLHPAGGPRVKDPRLDDELEEILQRLRAETRREKQDNKHTQYNIIYKYFIYTETSPTGAFIILFTCFIFIFIVLLQKNLTEKLDFIH